MSFYLGSYTDRIPENQSIKFTTRYVPDGISPDLYTYFRRSSSAKLALLDEGGQTISATDIRPLLYLPPNPVDSRNDLGYFQEFGNLQTITVSSHRPAAPVRRLGNASASYTRGVRTIAGTMIFGRTDRDAFMEAFGRCELERPDLVPFFIDQIPPFHVILYGQNELGVQATASILNITLTDYGAPFSVDDIAPDVTYSYVAQWMHPFMNTKFWRREVRDAVSALNTSTGSTVSSLGPNAANRNIVRND